MYKIFFIILFATFSFGSNLDVLFNKFISIYNKTKTEKLTTENIHKCNFETIYNIKTNFHLFNKFQQNLIEYHLNSVTITDTFIISPSGKFRINFSKALSSYPKYNVDSVGIIIDSVYKYQVEYLGFIPPKGKVDDIYDIYINNISDYGYTELLYQNPIRSQIVLSTDYSNYYTSGLEAIKVTLAHEFHHAIQFNYKLPDSDIFFYELTSTSMEEFVFPEINDYVHYIKNYKPYYNFKFGDGYSQAVWNLFLVEYFNDISIIKTQWEFFRSNSALNSIELSLKSKGEKFLTVFPAFASSLLPNNRYRYYKDWELFPKLKFIPLLKYPNTTNYLTDISYGGIRYFGVIKDNIDTSYAFLINSNSKAANEAQTDNEGVGVELIISKNQISNSQILSNGLYIAANFNKYDEGNKLFTQGEISNLSSITIYPNPIVMTKNNLLNLRFNTHITSCELDIFDINYNKKINKILYNNNLFQIVLDNNLSTGIYFVNIKADGKVFKTKIAVIK